MGIPWEWERTMYNLGTGMGMGIAMQEWEGMGMSKCAWKNSRTSVRYRFVERIVDFE